MSKKIDTSSLGSYTNGELLSYCEKMNLPITSNPSREQMISTIKKNSLASDNRTSEQSSAVNSEPREHKTATFSQLNSQKKISRFPSKKDVRLSTPRISFSSPNNQPTPILANQNADYEKMWEKKLGQTNIKYKEAFPSEAGVPSSIKRISEAERVLSPTQKKEVEKKGKTSTAKKLVIAIEVIILIGLIAIIASQ